MRRIWKNMAPTNSWHSSIDFGPTRRYIIIVTKILMHTVFFVLAARIAVSQDASGETRYLILNFDCRGEAAGASKSIGESLRAGLNMRGGRLVSRDLFEKAMKQGDLNESDLNYTINDLKATLKLVGADCAVYGQIYSSENIFVVDLKYIASGSDKPILFDPIICGSIADIHAVLPDIALMILAPDKSPPHVASVEPSDKAIDVSQLIEIKIVFSEPMNPSTISISGSPSHMWQRFGDYIYDEKSNSFIIKIHLYPDIMYEFRVNGEDSRGFKDLAGNPAREFIWNFKTAR